MNLTGYSLLNSAKSQKHPIFPLITTIFYLSENKRIIESSFENVECLKMTTRVGTVIVRSFVTRPKNLVFRNLLLTFVSIFFSFQKSIADFGPQKPTNRALAESIPKLPKSSTGAPGALRLPPQWTDLARRPSIIGITCAYGIRVRFAKTTRTTI